MKLNLNKEKLQKLFLNTKAKNSKIISFKSRVGELGTTKYSPSYSKEWKNTAYYFNKNKLVNIPFENPLINKIIKSYFNLYFKISNFTDINSKYFSLNKQRKYLKNIRNSLKRIYISNVEIKHTNNKALITLYIIDKEKEILKKKFLQKKKIINNNLYSNFFSVYRKNIAIIYNIFKTLRNNHIHTASIINKKNYMKYKFEQFNKFIVIKNLYIKRIWTAIIIKYWSIHLNKLRESTSYYYLNRYKFNQSLYLPILSNLLYKITNKKIEYNVINLKSIIYSADIFTNVLALKLKKRIPNHTKNMLSILNKTYLPKTNIIKERSLVEEQKNRSFFNNKFRDSKIISNLNHNSLDTLLNNIYSSVSDKNSKSIHNTIYNSIKYKNISGIRLEVKGRLTKRYRADRSIYSLRWKGGLKNIDSSFKRSSAVLFRGNKKPNVSYFMFTTKRRIGAFAVKGWIGGK